MKKLIIALVCFHYLSIAETQAQPNAVLYQINIKSVRSFVLKYPAAENVVWHDSNEGGAMCGFTLKGERYRAYYSHSGVWQGTVCSYDEKHLDKDIRAMVRTNYYDYNITNIDEVQLPGSDKVYFILIEDQKELKLLRIEDFEMVVVQELRKG